MAEESRVFRRERRQQGARRLSGAVQPGADRGRGIERNRQLIDGPQRRDQRGVMDRFEPLRGLERDLARDRIQFCARLSYCGAQDLFFFMGCADLIGRVGRIDLAAGNQIRGTLKNAALRRQTKGPAPGPPAALRALLQAPLKRLEHGQGGLVGRVAILILTEAPPATRSRVMGIVTMCIGTGPVGVMMIGILSRQIGPPAAILIMAGLGISGLSLVWRKLIKVPAGR